MRTFLSLPTKNSYGKILHITDTHLFTDSKDTLLGINTNDSFHSVIAEIENNSQDYDLIVATGDFVQDGSIGAYRRFADRISQLAIPCVWLPGNHDVSAYMQQVFAEFKLPAEKLILLGDDWLLILLDSQVVGEAHGKLSGEQLSFLTQALCDYPERKALVFLHHHPVMSGCQWLDQHCLHNKDELECVIMQYSQVKGLGCGHIHQVIAHQWGECTIFSTPSTCVQFKPNCHNFTLEQCSPGWRSISLCKDGSIESDVHYLASMLLLPDLTINGY